MPRVPAFPAPFRGESLPEGLRGERITTADVDALVVLSVTGLGAGITYVMVKFELSLCQSLLPCFPQSLLRVAWLLLKTATVSILEEWSQILGRDGVPPGAVMRLSRTPQAEAASSASPAGDGQPPGFL